MGRFDNGPWFYLLVAAVGVVAALASTALYIVYLTIWSFTINVLNSLIALFFLLAFLALGASYALVKLFADTKTTGSGGHRVLEAYHLTNGRVSLRDTIVKPLASVLTLGFGGSAGPEGPSLLVGGGIASKISERFKVRSDRQRRLFISGAAAGLAATFRTPLTAILFALEIPYRNDLDRETFIEASIASIPAYLISILILGSETIFGTVPSKPITLTEIAVSLGLGLICGLYAVFFVKIFSLTEGFSVRLRKRTGILGLVLIGTAFLSVAAYISVFSVGVGLNFMSETIKGTSFAAGLLLTIVLLKTFATSITLNSGGNGGLFFPTIVIGAGIGYLFATLVSPDLGIVLVAVGMAALLSGTHKILLTPTAFVVETLGGIYAIPALLASGVSYLVSRDYSFYPLQPRTRLKAEELAVERFFTKAKMLIPKQLKETTANQIMTKNPIYLQHGKTTKEALLAFEKTKLRVLPVVDDRLRVVGSVTLEDLAHLDIPHSDVTLSETLMHIPVTIESDTSLEKIGEIMIEKQEDHLYVVDNNEALIGVVSGIDLVREILELMSQ